jgi:DNA polymerase/3'-5' exonuclease PolX
MASKSKIVLKKKLSLSNEKDNSESKPEKSEKSTLVNLKLRKKADDEDSSNPNRKIIEVLMKLIKQIQAENKSIADKSEKTKNEFRVKSMFKAMMILKEHPKEIRSGEEAKELKGIGQGIADRIDEILETGTLNELADKEVVNEETKAVDDLITVNGIGEKTALRFYRDYGIKSVADLMERWREGKFTVDKYKLTHHIELGLKYYDDFRVRIPREEIDNFNVKVNTFIKDLDSKLIYEIAGSYRRKKPDSGDIDILMSHPDLKTKSDLEKSSKNYLALFIEKLLDEGIIIDHMDEDFSSYYKGVILLDKIPRRLDVMIIPHNTWAAALMHNTGSGPFNQRIRAHAMMKGYHLSQHGLYKVVNGQKEEEPIETTSEKQIFDILGVVYLRPEERD